MLFGTVEGVSRYFRHPLPVACLRVQAKGYTGNVVCPLTRLAMGARNFLLASAKNEALQDFCFAAVRLVTPKTAPGFIPQCATRRKKDGEV
ncbi:MAG TPA: hypothetical protein VLW75_01750, partial [Rhizomicrobium sp.]|nr:hypothetical protein [Rhizomicrobium sp.]